MFLNGDSEENKLLPLHPFLKTMKDGTQQGSLSRTEKLRSFDMEQERLVEIKVTIWIAMYEGRRPPVT